MPGKSKPKAKSTSRASTPRRPAASPKSSKPKSSKPKSPPKGSAKAKTGTGTKSSTATSGSRRIDEKIASLGDWRSETLSQVRRMIHEADPEIVEDCKWVKRSNPMGVPVWSHGGIVCTGESYREAVKLTFARGASLKDPKGLFNSSLGGGTRRAIDIRKGEALNAEAFKALIRAAVMENLRV